MATSVVLQKVEKRYGALDVIHGIDLTIDPGEFRRLRGPSGCGKSTLLRMIAGLEEISGGTLMLDSTRMNEVAPARRGICHGVPVLCALSAHVGLQDLAFGLETAGFKKAEIEPKVRRAAEILQIEKLLDRKPKALSGGQRKRVAIGPRDRARAADLPLRRAAFQSRRRTPRADARGDLKASSDSATPMIYVTHDQVEAMTRPTRSSS
ncbi:ATP-binding cassette domain-containing protein [Sinorhizobium meliloti]|nr:ATP-binding cassette domain-containing protein [Sinorhizobium meliloti]